MFTVLGKGGSWEVAIFSSYFITALRRAVSCLLHDNDLEVEHHAATSRLLFLYTSTDIKSIKQPKRTEACKVTVHFPPLSFLQILVDFCIPHTCRQSWALVFDRRMSLDTKHNIYRHRSFHNVSSKVVITA